MEPILATFDSERDTVLECDSSGYATGGVLSQYDEEGILRPCAYFSRKNNAHECNYEIHDKELLAVVRCLEEWDAELRSVKSFKDLPEDAGDERLQKRIVQILKPTSRCYEEASEDEEDSDKSWVMSARIRINKTPPPTSGTEQSEQVGQTGDSPSPTEGQSEQQEDLAQRNELEELWLEALKNDRQYQEATQAVIGQERRFPPSLGVKCSISECEVSNQGGLLYRGRRWVPDNESLRTKIISGVHDSLSAGHPGEITYKILAREFFWPGMTGLLKPLPIPDRIWKEISMDFIEGLPTSEGMTFLMVVTDRLSKGSIFIPLPDIKTETVVRAFLRQVVAYHWLPDAITSDRGSQFVSVLWERLEILKIRRRLSTSFHPKLMARPRG
ncbi:hypothetical protein P3342_002419 [Pyrenophora teres f. teres]|nr:hypothetical protein P3342_002419 [Pyrenophora teres f. teres]